MYKANSRSIITSVIYFNWNFFKNKD